MSDSRTRKSSKKKRGAPKREYKFRLNPLRQAALVGLALAGIGIGYGLGYLSKEKAQPVKQSKVEKPSAPARLIMAPLLPETTNGVKEKTARPYEEALPKDIIESERPILGFEGPKAAPPEPSPAPASKPAEQPTREAKVSSVAKPAPAEKPKPEKTTPPLSKPEPKVAALVDKPAPSLETKPRIAIVIDDLGIDKARTARTIRLKGPLTLSFMTYATGLKKQTQAARQAGHELWMHIPMEPGSTDIDPGPNVLLTGIPEQELLTSLKWNLDQFSGYVGINNHMGSRFTADLAGMTLVMKELKKRNLFFLDSVTSGKTVGRRAAKSVGVPFIVRNVFLDHLDDVAGIQKRLQEVERLARKAGIAVAIGHPREATLLALLPWLEKIESRGFRLIPLSDAIK